MLWLTLFNWSKLYIRKPLHTAKFIHNLKKFKKKPKQKSSTNLLVVCTESNINQTLLAQDKLSGFRLHILDFDSSTQFLLDSCWSSLDQRWLWGDVTVLFFSLTRLPFFKRLNLPLSVSKPTVICPKFLWKVRWLPRFSQPVQCKDRKSQGSTPHTPTSNP